MSGEIRDELDDLGVIDSSGDTPIPKSLGGALTDAQYEKLTGAKTGKSLRIPDKYCLGRFELKDYRVKEYLGGVDAISVFKNGSSIRDEKQKPPVYLRNNVIVFDRPCVDYVNLECVINYKTRIM